MNLQEYTEHDGLGLADLVRRGEVSAAELKAAAIECIEQVNPQLNAVVQVLTEQTGEDIPADENAPFTGVPLLVKEELCHMAGVPFAMGSRLSKGLVLDHDSELMIRFKRAGLQPAGTTTLPEFGFAPTCESVLYGPTHNPWKRGYSVGGSSGGSAAGVAAGITPIAYGNDGGGSIRIPASSCGLVGLKPTRGRIPTGPDNGELLGGLGVEFALTKTVRDTAALLDAVAGPDAGCPNWAEPPPQSYSATLQQKPPALRIAWSAAPFMDVPVHPECVRVLHETVRLCEELGHTLVEATPSFDIAAHLDATTTIWCAHLALGMSEIAAMFNRQINGDTLETASMACHEHGMQLSATELVAAQEVYAGTTRLIGRFFEDYDVLLTPVLSEPTVQHGVIDQNEPGMTAEAWVKKIFGYAAFTGPFNTTGQPAISLPLGMSDGMPIGMQFAARFADETTLIQLAAQLEAANPWIARRPPVYAGGA